MKYLSSRLDKWINFYVSGNLKINYDKHISFKSECARAGFCAAIQQIHLGHWNNNLYIRTIRDKSRATLEIPSRVNITIYPIPYYRWFFKL